MDADPDFELALVSEDEEEAEPEDDGWPLADVVDFGLLAFFVFAGRACAPSPGWVQFAPDGVRLADVVALPDDGEVDAAVPVEVAVVLLAPDALVVPVDGLGGGLLLAPDEAPGVDIADGPVVLDGLLVFGDVGADEVGELEDPAGHDAASTGVCPDVVVATPAVEVVATTAPEAASPDAPWLDPVPLPVLLCPVNTEELSCTTACRSGGTASATPIANTAQAAARAGLSMTSRMSKPLRQPDRARRDRVRDFPGWVPPGPDLSLRPGGPEGPPGGPAAPGGTAPGGTGAGGDPGTGPGNGIALASVGPPARILARMRSRPSGRGST